MPLSDEILEPVPGDDPAGRFLRYDTTDTTYADIKEAREEEEDLPQGEWKRERKTADWRRVEDLATEALESESKDLQIAAWLAEALTHRHGFGGLADGLWLLRRLLEEYWEGIFPPLEDGDAGFRATALSWANGHLSTAVKKVPLTNYGFDYHGYRTSRKVGYEEDAEGDAEKQRAREEAVEAGKPTAEEFDEAFDGTEKAWYREAAAGIERTVEELDALEAVVEEKFEDEDPDFRDLRREMEDVRDVVGELLDEKLEQDPDPPELEEVGGAGAGEEARGREGTAGGGDGASPDAGGRRTGEVVLEERDDADDLVARAARFMRGEDLTDPGPYLMLRGLRWGEIRGGGDGIDPKLLAAPPTDVRTNLKEHLLDGEWEELLEAAERVMATPWGRGWLDLQRYVITACDELGGDYEVVGWCIRRAVRSLLRDLPELPDLTLMDDSPTANRETRSWLRDEGLLDAGEEDEEGGTPRPTPPRERTQRGARERARQKLRSGDPDGAIRLLMSRVEQEKSERARFLGLAEATRIMVESGREEVAMPILRDMLEEIEEHNLEEWEEGETVALPLGLLYHCIDELEGDTAQKEQLYERVCRLDPMQALEFTPARPDGGAEEPGSMTADEEPGSMTAGSDDAMRPGDGQ